MDRANTNEEFDALYHKYADKPRKIKLQIASRLRCNQMGNPVTWKNIYKVIGGKWDTVKNRGRKTSGFELLCNFTNPRNPKLEIALIQHVLNSNNDGFMLNIELFQMKALKLNAILRREAAQTNQLDAYPTSHFVCSTEFFTDFKKKLQQQQIIKMVVIVDIVLTRPYSNGLQMLRIFKAQIILVERQ